MRINFTIFMPVFLAFFFSAGQLNATCQSGGENKTLPIVLYLDAADVQAHQVDIGYEINYPGFLEFHLFDNDGKRIFLTSMVKEKGKHAMRLKKKKLASSKTYSYYFIYKGKQYHGSFKV